jgi:hypothetical protein
VALGFEAGGHWPIFLKRAEDSLMEFLGYSGNYKFIYEQQVAVCEIKQIVFILL